MKRLIEKLSLVTSHPLARGSAVVLIGSMAANVGAYFYHVVVGRLLGPEQYGELASLYSLSYLLNVPSLVIQTVIAKYVSAYKAKKENGKAKELVITATQSMGYWMIAILILTVPLYRFFVQYLHVTNYWSVVYVFIGSGIVFLGTVITGTLQGYQQFTELMVFSNIGVVLRLIGGFIGASYSVAATAFANALTAFIAYVLSFIPLRFLRASTRQKTGLTKRDIGTFAVPSLLCILGITSLYNTDIMLVKHYFSSYEAGMYAALSMMGKVIFFASSSFSYVLFPVVAERSHVGGRSDRLVYISLAAVACISLGITVGYYIFPSVALGLLFGSSYAGASGYLGLFGIFISFFSLSNILSTTLLGMGNKSVWMFTVSFSLLQILGIMAVHDSLRSVLYLNIGVSTALFMMLLVYYRHAVKKH
ncbi:MAG: hypothetical protein AAB542_01900 [Patescibacteria group bacterium]